MPKIKYDLKPVRASTSGKHNPRLNNSEFINKSILVDNNSNAIMNKTFNGPQTNNLS